MCCPTKSGHESVCLSKLENSPQNTARILGDLRFFCSRLMFPYHLYDLATPSYAGAVSETKLVFLPFVPAADCVTVADMAMPSLPSSPYSPSPSSSSSSSTSYPPSHPLFGPGGPSSLYAAGDGSPPLFMSLPFPLPPSPHRPYEPWPRSDVAPFLASMSGGVPPPPPLTQRPSLPRPIPTAGVHVPPLTRYDGMAGDVAVTAASNAAAVAAAASTYVSSVYAYERGSAGMPPHMEHHPGIPLPSYGPSLIWWD